MKKSTKTPPMSPPDYGQSLQGVSINLLVRDLAKALHFQREVLGTTLIYHDQDLIIAQWRGSQWMIHADHTYLNHALLPYTSPISVRGAGIEIRLHGCDPDLAEEKARAHGYQILVPAKDQAPHGLREAHILDADGYVWVPDRHL